MTDYFIIAFGAFAKIYKACMTSLAFKHMYDKYELLFLSHLYRFICKEREKSEKMRMKIEEITSFNQLVAISTNFLCVT